VIDFSFDFPSDAVFSNLYFTFQRCPAHHRLFHQGLYPINPLNPPDPSFFFPTTPLPRSNSKRYSHPTHHLACITSKDNENIMLVLTSNCLTLINPLNLVNIRKIEIQTGLYAHISASGSLVAIAHQCYIITYIPLDSESLSQVSIPGVIHSIAFLPHTSLLLLLHTRENGMHCVLSYRSSLQTSFVMLGEGLIML
jgi:hypothetical protein